MAAYATIVVEIPVNTEVQARNLADRVERQVRLMGYEAWVKVVEVDRCHEEESE